jgi:hypothetical protein
MTRLPLLAPCALAAVLALPAPAAAYPWMISHEYTGCAACHADPSGGGLMTRYGRAQSELLLRTRYGAVKEGEEPKYGGFLLGAVELPESVLAGGDVRYSIMRTAAGPTTTYHGFIMQADAAAQVSVDRFRAAGTLGYAGEGALGATLAGTKNRLIGRTYWLAADFGEEKEWVVRAGRLNLPYGLRIIEHTTFVRQATRTDIDASQQEGLAVAYTGSKVRGEAMAILGNYQVSPDKFRERGYSAYLEWSARERLSLGVSSLITHDARDAQLQTALWRQSHGVFARFAPLRRVVLLAEADVLLWSEPPGTNIFGFASFLQVDYEIVRGVHVMATGESLTNAPGPAPAGGTSAGSGGTSAGAWGSAVWFFAPHADVRLDAVYSSLVASGSRSGMTAVLGQIHVFF